MSIFPRSRRIPLPPARNVAIVARRYLLAGMAMTIALAWLCAAIPSPRGGRGSLVTADRLDRPWLERGERYLREPDADCTRTFEVREDRLPGLVRRVYYNHVRPRPRPPAPPGFVDNRVSLTARFASQVLAGFPFPALRGGYHHRIYEPPYEVVGAVPLGSGTGILEYRRVLPVRPIWIGLFADTVFFAALLLVLVRICHRVGERWKRARRGRCPKCRYPIGVSAACTECGAALPEQFEEARLGSGVWSITNPDEASEQDDAPPDLVRALAGRRSAADAAPVHVGDQSK